MNNLPDKSLCYGCGACANSCPKDAIVMQEDSEGFLYPILDISRCIDCKQCLKVCSALESKFEPKRIPTKKGLAVRSDEYAPGSTSGGAFALMANKVLSMGGYVVGAVFDDQWGVKHIVTNSKSGVDQMRGSKYLQSDIKTVYTETKSLLDNGKFVLFSGTPCQIAGLYGYLGRDYDNLLTVDLICHGVNSPAIWKKYLNEITEGEKVSAITCRDKSMSMVDPNYESGGGG